MTTDIEFSNKNNKTLSIILLSYYSEQRIEKCYDSIRSLLSKENIPFEFIVVDDGSKDQSYQYALKLEEKHENVRAYQLSRNFTSHYSIFAGLSICKGACAMPMVDDEQQPYETIVDMYRLWEQGNKVIIPYRTRRNDPWSSRLFSNTYYWILNRCTDFNMPPGGADLYFIDREVIDILNTKIHPINTNSLMEVLRLGFSPYFYGYERPLGLNAGSSRWTFLKKWKLAKDSLISSTSFPIQMILYLGFWCSLLSFTASIFYVYIAIWGNHEFWGMRVPGWTSIVLLIFFFGGLNLLSLGIISEYIWRIYEEVKGRPGFIIRKKDKERDNSNVERE